MIIPFVKIKKQSATNCADHILNILSFDCAKFCVIQQNAGSHRDFPATVLTRQRFIWLILLQRKTREISRVKSFVKRNYYFFLHAHFLAAGFLAATFLAAGFLATTFLAAGFLAATFLAAGFLATTFLAAGFLATTFLATGFLAATFLAAGFLAAGFLAAGFFAAGLAAGFFAAGFAAFFAENKNAILLSFLCFG